MKNFQQIRKVNNGDGQILDVHSVFYTIQGEGPFTGNPAVFIRLAGCNLQCPGCDTDYTGGIGKVSIDRVITFVEKLNEAAKLVVITGGEPFRQNITPLVSLLQLHNFNVQVETNGTLPPSKEFPNGVTIVCSPKSGKVNIELEKIVSCYKYVLSSNSISAYDGLPLFVLSHSASPQVARPINGKKVYLQPMDTYNEDENKKNLKACVDSCMKYGHTLQIQLHKIIGVL